MAKRQDFLQHFDRQNYQDFENLSTGDFIKVGWVIQENEKKRLQFFEGRILAFQGPSFGKKVTLRTAGIERVFCCQNPQIQTLTVLKSPKSHRSKLYYLRQRVGYRFGLRSGDR
uniref:Ribosomal protein L19 n=1 Tax=Rhipilia penicilloides TaxID=1979422 RepID=A0A2P0QJ09_9CHLO|nr:ribosomal protein L19 [Rhipilia penicilloides]ARO74298.1 ribosomal protein L19 [Rhipilia penicilloides]